VQNDDKPDLLFVVKDSAGDPVNLTGSTVDFHFREQGTSVLKNAGHTACTPTDEGNGEYKYEWATGDLDTVGIFEGELQVTYVNTKVQTVYAKYDFEIREEYD
jgi:hypothetical protein